METAEVAKKSAEAELPVEPPSFDINTASATRLAEELGLDPRRARIVAQFRAIYGPFAHPEDLAQVSGITDSQVIRWEDDGLLNFD